MKYCKKCILPETYPGIFFDAEGICNFCLDYEPFHRYLGKDSLIEVLNSDKIRGKFDCVVPSSGGKDSTFILYYAVKELKLNPIVISYDSGFQSEIAKENIRNACSVLRIPFEIVKSPGDLQMKLLKESLRISKKIGDFIYYCGNCEAIIRNVSINTARKYGAPFVLWGASALETLSNENYTEYRHTGRKKSRLISSLNNITAKLDIVLKDPWKLSRIPRKIYPYVGFHTIKYKIYSIRQRYNLHFPLRYAIRPKLVLPFTLKNPKFIHFFDYIQWDSINYIKILKSELNWKHPEKRISRFDCSIHCLANFDYLRKYGISHDGVNFCNFIRENRMSRDETLAREKDILDSLETEYNELLNKTGLKNFKI